MNKCVCKGCKYFEQCGDSERTESCKGKVENKYITYEEPLKGKSFTEKQMHEVYRDMADKTEYPDFESWFADMLKSGVFEEVNI